MGRLNRILIMVFILLFIAVIAEGAYYFVFMSKKPVLPASNNDSKKYNTVCVNEDMDFFQSVKDKTVSGASLTTVYKGSVNSIAKDPGTGLTNLKVDIEGEKDLRQSFVLPDALIAKIKFLDKDGSDITKEGLSGLKTNDKITVTVDMDLKKIVMNPNLQNDDIMSVVNSFVVKKN